MANDVFYGEECELRIGVRADRDTAPTAWFGLEFTKITLNYSREQVAKPRLGAPRANPVEPLKPRKGLLKVAVDWQIDADLLSFPRLLRSMLGAPTTTGPSGGLYTHVWAPANKTEFYFDIAILAGDGVMHWVQSCALSTLAVDAGAENVNGQELSLALMAINRIRDGSGDWPAGSVTAVTAPAPILRTRLLLDSTAVGQVLSAGFTLDRNLQADTYAPLTAPSGEQTVSNLRPGDKQVSAGRANIRAAASEWDDLADAATDFAPELQLHGATSGQVIKLSIAQAELPVQPTTVGAGVTERSFSWTGHQTDSAASSSITVVNAVASYAA